MILQHGPEKTGPGSNVTRPFEPVAGRLGDRGSSSPDYTPAGIVEIPLVRVERTTRGLGNRCSIL